MIALKQPFLLSLEEKSIKSENKHYKDENQIDKDIIHQMDLLNNINGLATLFSCQSHPERNKNSSYLVLKCSEELCHPLTEALYSIQEEMDVDVDWFGSVHYEILGVDMIIDSVISIHGGTDYSYFEKLVKYLVD